MLPEAEKILSPISAPRHVILVVDDDAVQRTAAAHFLQSQLHIHIEEVISGMRALARLSNPHLPPVKLVLLDLFMPDMDGRETLRRIRANHPTLPVIMLTGSDYIEDAVTLMRDGACDFITKPFNRERLKLSVEQQLTMGALKNQVSRLTRREEYLGSFDDLIGSAQGLAEQVALARKAAASDIPVLICGESGTGKEMLARAIHGHSKRAGKAFVAINCGAIPENLVESTLFGHEKGSFTGAIARELGKFREAAGGTLFLDEVGELKPDIQTKLLRALQSHEIAPVGAGKSVQVDVRILSATHRNLAQDIGSNRFREDLYYRLNVLPITLPPLRERKSDIPALAMHMLARICVTEHKSPMVISEAGLGWLSGQTWPGNVRELENLLYRAVVIYDQRELGVVEFIAMTHKETLLPSGADTIALRDATGRARTWDEIEAEAIHSTLARCGGHIPQAAKLLGMGQSTLYKKLLAFGKDRCCDLKAKS